jgi:hypothetical protein
MKIWHEGTTVEYLGGCKVKFTCPNNHSTVKDYSKGPVSKRMGVRGVKMLVRCWQDRVTHVCKKC